MNYHDIIHRCAHAFYYMIINLIAVVRENKTYKMYHLRVNVEISYVSYYD